MNIEEMNLEELETRSLEIAEEVREADKETIERLNAELDSIEERKKVLHEEAEERAKAVEEVISGAGSTLEEIEERKMTNMEIRNSKEYIDAYAKYIKTGKDTECRALLTENITNGTVPVPEFVESRIRAAWDRDEIFSRVAKTYVRGNLKVGFEISATDASIHEEGTAAPLEEVLTLGIVTMVPSTIKKWISFSTEVQAMASNEFLAYVYDELTYKVIKKAADEVIEVITDAPAASTGTAVGVPTVAGGASVATLIDAKALLGDEARDIVAIMSRATEATIRKAVLNGSFNYDPFEGVTVLHNSLLGTSTYPDMIVGDLKGVQANMPEGDSVRFVYDELSLAERDLIKLVARLYVAIAVVGPNMLVKVAQA